MDLTYTGVTKFYGPVIGVNDVTFAVVPGITGLFGANGAGKSTLIKLASGQLRPSLGRVAIGEHSTWSTAAKRQFGYCPDLDRFYEDMTGRRFVHTMARLSGYSRFEADERTDACLEIVGMTDRASRKLAGCSHGMRQRIKLAQALVHDPPVLLLDEPMTGIDPVGRRDLSRVLEQLAASGKTILVSSHILGEVETLADRIVMIARGRMIAQGTLAEMRDWISEPLTVALETVDARSLAAKLIESGDVTSVEVTDQRLVVRTHDASLLFPLVADAVLSAGADVRRMEVLDAGAEAVFSYLDRQSP